MKNQKKLMVIVLALVAVLPLQARFHKVKSARELERLVDGYEFSVVCFAPSGQVDGQELTRDEKKDIKKDFKAVEDVVKASSRRPAYKDFLSKDVGFLMVDVTGKNAENLSSEYGVRSGPICFVFERGSVNKDKKIMRPASVKDLTKLLEQEGGTALQGLLKDRKQEESLRRQERISQNYAYSYAYPYWGGWGYGGYGGYGYGGFGCRFYGGWGRGGCW